MSNSTIYINNTSVVELDGLRDQDDSYENDATVTLQSFVDTLNGTAVSGVTTPLTMSYVSGSDGKYQGIITDNAGVTVGTLYEATIRAVSASGQQAEWVEKVQAVQRHA